MTAEYATGKVPLLGPDGKFPNRFAPTIVHETLVEMQQLEQSARDSAEAALEVAGTGTISPDILAAAVEWKMAEHVNADEPHPAYDIDMPSLTLTFENGLL